jgi:hypothetical protein
MKFLQLFVSLLLSIFVIVTLVELLAPPIKVETFSDEVIEEEPLIDDELSAIGSFYGVENPDQKLEIEESQKIFTISDLKTSHILKDSKIGFLLFYISIFITLVLQIFYTTLEKVSFIAIDFNLQAPPMLGVGGTIYALVNADIQGSASIVQELSAVLTGAGLTTLLGIFVFIINHFLSRYITVK